MTLTLTSTPRLNTNFNRNRNFSRNLVGDDEQHARGMALLERVIATLSGLIEKPQ